MKEKWMSSVMAGVFISMGAMTYLAIPNTLVGSLFFCGGNSPCAQPPQHACDKGVPADGV